MKKYKINPTEKQLEIIKLYWELFNIEQCVFLGKMARLEKLMSEETGIEDLEFFFCDGEYAGVGDVERNMKLIQREKLDD